MTLPQFIHFLFCKISIASFFQVFGSFFLLIPTIESHVRALVWRIMSIGAPPFFFLVMHRCTENHDGNHKCTRKEQKDLY